VAGVQNVGGGLLDHVALQRHPHHQPGRPVRQHRAERDVQPVQRQPVPVGAQLGHRQPGDRPTVTVVPVVPAAVVRMVGVVRVLGMVVVLRVASVVAVRRGVAGLGS
jgi:hypothetical protein